MLAKFVQVLQRDGRHPRQALETLRRHYEFVKRNRRLTRITEAIIVRQGLVVTGGPFVGMAYVNRAFCGGFAPKLIGCYEAELHATLASLRPDYTAIVDVGCAEGYYAVGLARRYLNLPVYAFDSDPTARELCAEMAKLNHVSAQVKIGGTCDTNALARLPLKGALLFCDCEGYEIELLNPQLLPDLQDCDLLVELHDCFNSLITPTILERFALTHKATLIQTSPHRPEEYPAVQFLSESDQRLAVDDLRGFPLQWVFLASHALRPEKMP